MIHESMNVTIHHVNPSCEPLWARRSPPPPQVLLYLLLMEARYGRPARQGLLWNSNLPFMHMVGCDAVPFM
jgi:hypothetical protein